MTTGRFSGPDFIFPFYADQFRNIQQVIQRIGAVPEFMLLPHPGGYRQEEEFIDVRAGQGDVSAVAVSVPDPPSPKKPARLQAMPSISSLMQDRVSCSSSG